MTSAAPEPTDEQLEIARQLREDAANNYRTNAQQDEAVARALAAAVAAEREKYEAVAIGLDELYEVHHKNWRSNGSTYAVGISAGLGLASDRIREVSR